MKIKKIMSTLLSVTMASCVLVAEPLPVKASEKVFVSNPRTADNGTVTWDKIQFGSYYQDAEFEEESIKWRILDIDSEGNAFLLADEALDCQPYNEEYPSCTWETCTLRDWLNGTDTYEKDEAAFINAAFTTEEQNEIIETTVENPDKGTPSSNTTTDKVYLLSISEASNANYGFHTGFSDSSSTRQVKATDYVRCKGVDRFNIDRNSSNCYWWLRSPGVNENYGARVSSAGSGSYQGADTRHDTYAVRPVLHVNLESSYVKDAGTVTSEGEVTEGTNATKNSSDYNKPSQSGDVTTWECVYFGNYKKKAVFNKKPIEWRVLSVNGNDAFVIADKALDCQLYNTDYQERSWATCTLRDWLNGTDDYANDSAFINVAFTDAEKNEIIEKTVENPINPTYNTAGGDNTTDKVYLLSILEASNANYGFDENYNSSEKRRAKSTDYARFRGSSSRNSGDVADNCEWWLRSPGESAYYAVYVDIYGWGRLVGNEVNYDTYSVRPALHVNLSSSYVKPAGNVSSDGTFVTAESIVDNLISEIGTVTKESQAAIKKAREEYDTLSEYSKTKVTKYTTLTAAETEYNDIISAVAVSDLIESIGTVTMESQAAIEKAREDYDKLSENAKTKVTNYEILTAAETKYNEIMKEEAQAARELIESLRKAKAVSDIIASIGEVNNTSKEKIEAAREAYNKLTSDEKALVTNYATLTAAETKYNEIVKNNSANQTVMSTSKVKITSAKNNKKKSIVVKWKKISNAKGYNLQYALNKKFTKSKKTKITTKSTLTIKKLKKGKTYYVRVRAYNTDSKGTKVYSKWSSVKKVKIKK